MSRARDMLDANEYSKMLRGNTSSCDAKEYNLVNLDDVVANYRDFLVDVAAKTNRVNEQPLRQGALHAYDVPAAEAQLFASRLSKAFQHCVVKSRSATTTKKLPPATAAVVRVLLGKSAAQKAANTAVKRTSPKKLSLPTKKTPEKSKQVASTPERPKTQVSESAVWSCPRTEVKDPSAERGVPVQTRSGARTRTPVACASRKRPASSAGVTPLKKPAGRVRRGTPKSPEVPLTGLSVTTTRKSLPVRSYVQARTTTPGGGPRLIAEFTAKKFPNHEELAHQVKKTIEDEQLGFTAARALRQRFESADSTE